MASPETFKIDWGTSTTSVEYQYQLINSKQPGRSTFTI